MVDHLIFADDGIRDNHHAIVRCLDMRGAQAYFLHIAQQQGQRHVSASRFDDVGVGDQLAEPGARGFAGLICHQVNLVQHDDVGAGENPCFHCLSSLSISA